MHSTTWRESPKEYAPELFRWTYKIMRSDKLGYNAPIEVYDRIYYRYADPEYSITEMPLSIEDCKLIKKAIILLENKKDKNNEDTIQVLNKVQDRLKSILNFV